MILTDRLPTTDHEKWDLVEEARRTWGEEVANLLAEDLGLKRAPGDEETQH